MLSKIFNGEYLPILDNIKQWQERDTVKKESVSQHTYKVVMFSTIILEDIFGNAGLPKVLEFKLDVITNAMFHDWDEIILKRDISHELKYNRINGDDIRKALDYYVQNKTNQIFRDTTDGKDPNKVAEFVINNMNKKDGIAKKFVKLCDWLALLFFINQENKLGNRQFDYEKKYCSNAIKDLLITLEEDFCFYFPYSKDSFLRVSNKIINLL